jgi:ribonuclease HII
MRRALAAVSPPPEIALIDGPFIPGGEVPAKAVVGGDGLCFSIAAASILAKVTRDRLMLEYHARFPEYGFDRHKGYGTLGHRQALEKWGPCPIHRRTFLKNVALPKFPEGADAGRQ